MAILCSLESQPTEVALTTTIMTSAVVLLSVRRTSQIAHVFVSCHSKALRESGIQLVCTKNSNDHWKKVTSAFSVCYNSPGDIEVYKRAWDLSGWYDALICFCVRFTGVDRHMEEKRAWLFCISIQECVRQEWIMWRSREEYSLERERKKKVDSMAKLRSMFDLCLRLLMGEE